MSSSVSGLGSSQITSELDSYEERLQEPITQLSDQITTDKADISAWGTIQGSISTLSTALSGIEDLSTINTRTASVGAGGAFTATASSAAQTGTYNVNVKALASVQEIYSTASSTTASAKIGSGKSGSLTFTLGSGTKTKTEIVAVGSGSMTLNGIASAINKMAGGVKAGVVSTANGAELTLQSSATGASQAFTVTASSSNPALAKFDYTSTTTSGTTEPSASVMKLAQSAANSSLTINGVPITATSNKISSAMTGVSLTLTGTGTSTLTIGSSTAGISSAVGKVATDLNAAIASIAKETYWAGSSTTTSSSSASSTAEKSGGLAGNSTAESISNQLLSAVSGAAASGMTSNSIGLTVSSKGAVALNSTTFASAYAKNPAAVQKLLGQIYTGLSTVTKQALGSSTGTNVTGNAVGEGTITAQTEAETNSVASINSEISQMEKTDTTELDNLAAAYSTSESAASNASITSMYLDIFTSASTSSSS